MPPSSCHKQLQTWSACIVIKNIFSESSTSSSQYTPSIVCQQFCILVMPFMLHNLAFQLHPLGYFSASVFCLNPCIDATLQLSSVWYWFMLLCGLYALHCGVVREKCKMYIADEGRITRFVGCTTTWNSRTLWGCRRRICLCWTDEIVVGRKTEPRLIEETTAVKHRYGQALA